MNAPAAALAIPTDLTPGTPFGGGIFCTYRYEGTRPYLLICADQEGEIQEGPHADAVKQIAALRIDGHNDWSLPTRGEALDLYEHLHPKLDGEGAFEEDWYWTSQDYAKNNTQCAWFQCFFYGDQDDTRKYGPSCRARAVRRLFI